MNDAADFLIAADDGIELALAGAVDQIDAVFLQGLELAFGSLIGDALRAANGLHGGEQLFFGDRVELEEVFGFGFGFGEGEQEMLGRDEVVFHRRGFFLRRFEDLAQGGAEAWLGDCATLLGQMIQFAFDHPIEIAAVNADFFQERPDDAFILGQQRGEQMQRIDLRIAVLGSELLAR